MNGERPPSVGGLFHFASITVLPSTIEAANLPPAPPVVNATLWACLRRARLAHTGSGLHVITADAKRAINDGVPLLRAKVGSPFFDLGQGQRSFGAHAMFSRT
jgi:hypothetical protein